MKTRKPQKLDLLRRRIKAQQSLYDYTNEQMGVFLGVSARSYSRRLADPEKMTVKDLIILENKLKTTLLIAAE